MFFCLLSTCLDLHYFQVFWGHWDLYVVGRRVFSDAVVSDQEDVVIFVGTVEDLSLGAACRVSFHFLAMSYQHLLLQFLAFSYFFEVIVCSCWFLARPLLWSHPSFEVGPHQRTSRSLLYNFMRGLLLNTIVDDIRVDCFDFPPSVYQEMVEFFILSVVVVDHVYFAEIELGEFCAFVVFVEAAEALPL